MIIFGEKTICLPLKAPNVYKDHAIAKVYVSLLV